MEVIGTPYRTSTQQSAQYPDMPMPPDVHVRQDGGRGMTLHETEQEAVQALIEREEASGGTGKGGKATAR